MRRYSNWVPVPVYGFAGLMGLSYWLVGGDNAGAFTAIMFFVASFCLIPWFVDWDLANSARDSD